MNFHYFTAASKHTNQQTHSFLYHMSLETKVVKEDTAVNQKFPLLDLFCYIELVDTLTILTLLILACNMHAGASTSTPRSVDR